MNLLGIIVLVAQIMIQTVSYIIGLRLKDRQNNETAPAQMMCLSGLLTSIIFGFRQGFTYFILSVSVVILTQACYYVYSQKKGGHKK